VLWAGAEEVGVFGGDAYYKAHKDEPHALAAESDFGADRIWQVNFRLPETAAPLRARISDALAAQGIGTGRGVASGGADVGQMIGAGTPAIDLNQDGTRYFDLHHTADDTLDKVDPAALRQNVAAWTTMLDLVANAPEDLLSRGGK
jgi:Zn-dependent M28 family amino/carboxypeptidase